MRTKDPIKRKEKRQFKHQKNIDESLKILEATISALDKHNIKYYLDFGTLLGAVREERLIPWDDDMDISLIDEADYHKIPDVLSDIEDMKFRVSLVSFYRSIENRKKKAKADNSIKVFTENIEFTDINYYRVAKVRNYRFFNKIGRGRNCLDIFFKYKKSDTLYWMAQHKVHTIPKEVLGKELIEIDFYHLKCKIPKNYDAYLTSMYGDWKTPKEDWQYYEHETCISKKSHDA